MIKTEMVKCQECGIIVGEYPMMDDHYQLLDLLLRVSAMKEKLFDEIWPLFSAKSPELSQLLDDIEKKLNEN